MSWRNYCPCKGVLDCIGAGFEPGGNCKFAHPSLCGTSPKSCLFTSKAEENEERLIGKLGGAGSPPNGVVDV